jgi:hypothetical protein
MDITMQELIIVKNAMINVPPAQELLINVLFVQHLMLQQHLIAYAKTNFMILMENQYVLRVNPNVLNVQEQ